MELICAMKARPILHGHTLYFHNLIHLLDSFSEIAQYRKSSSWVMMKITQSFITKKLKPTFNKKCHHERSKSQRVPDPELPE